MAEKSSFFNSIIVNNIPDRPSKAENFASYFGSFIGNGVFPNPSINLQVIANNDMTITIKQGKAWINGYFYYNDSNLNLTVDNADGVLKRIDRVVVRLDFINRNITTKIKKGTVDTNPVAQELQRDVDVYELGIADILIGNGVISITQSDITDTRLNSELCGIVTQTVNTIDTTTLYNQLEAWKLEEIQNFNAWRDLQETNQDTWFNTTTNKLTIDFNTWFDTVKGILDGDVAGNLTNRIIELENKVGNGLTADNITMLDGTTVEASILNLQNNDGDLSQLQTQDRTNLVNAINEIVSNIGENITLMQEDIDTIRGVL